MCWVMPPRSPAATSVVRIASSRLVLPWSTWPMTVTIGARGWSRRRVVLLEEDFLGGRAPGASPSPSAAAPVVGAIVSATS